MSDLQLDYAVPSDDLAPFVTMFYLFKASVAFFDDVERADYAQFRFRLSDGTGTYLFGDGSEQDAPTIHVLGPTSSAFRTRAEGPLIAFGMGLTPAGWATLMAVDASAMVNRSIDAHALFGPRATEAWKALRVAPDMAAMVALAEAMVRSIIAERYDGATLRFCQQVDAWLAGAASPAIDDLSQVSRLSRRQVERRCNALYGCPPKLLARKYRALRAAVAIAGGTATADDLIADGFYDQSHLIREIKQFTGRTPRQMRSEPGVLAQLVTERRRELEGRVAPLFIET